MNLNRLSGLLPLVPALLLLAALLAALPNDPASGFTISSSPFTDEGYHLVNARNLVVLGDWSSGDWNLHLVDGPFGAAMAGVFSLFGVGLLPARALVVLLSASSVAILGLLVAARFGTRFGALTGLTAGFALAGNALTLYYGRLAFLEPLVTFFLVAGTATLLLAPRRASVRLSVAGGALLGLAIATKASAAVAVLGIVAGIALAGSLHDPRTRRSTAGAIAGIVGVGIGWLVVVGLPNWQAVLADLRIWAQPEGPTDAADLLVRLADYVGKSDGAVPAMFTSLLAAAGGAYWAGHRWRSLDRGMRLLIGAAAGWFGAGMLLVMAIDYRPNRYVVPMLPALAVLVAVAAWDVAWRLRGSAAARVAAVAVLGIGLVTPGAVAYAGWTASSTQRGLQLQAELAARVAPGEAVEGEMAPTLALTTRSPIFVSRPSDDIDAGDLRHDANVRWVIVGPADAPRWIGSAPDAWANRRIASCFSWGGEQKCLVQLG